jgi:hypothetical protein
MPVSAAPTIWGNISPRNENFTERADILARLNPGCAVPRARAAPGCVRARRTASRLSCPVCRGMKSALGTCQSNVARPERGIGHPARYGPDLPGCESRSRQAGQGTWRGRVARVPLPPDIRPETPPQLRPAAPGTGWRAAQLALSRLSQPILEPKLLKLQLDAESIIRASAASRAESPVASHWVRLMSRTSSSRPSATSTFMLLPQLASEPPIRLWGRAVLLRCYRTLSPREVTIAALTSGGIMDRFRNIGNGVVRA